MVCLLPWVGAVVGGDDANVCCTMPGCGYLGEAVFALVPGSNGTNGDQGQCVLQRPTCWPELQRYDSRTRFRFVKRKRHHGVLPTRVGVSSLDPLRALCFFCNGATEM